MTGGRKVALHFSFSDLYFCRICLNFDEQVDVVCPLKFDDGYLCRDSWSEMAPEH